MKREELIAGLVHTAELLREGRSPRQAEFVEAALTALQSEAGRVSVPRERLEELLAEIGATQDQRAADASVPYTEGRPLVTTPAHPAAHPLPTPRTDAAIGKFTRRTYTEACICVDAEDMRTIEREAAELRAQLAEQNERHEFELATAHKAALTALQSREEVVRELPPFDEVVREILGTPCFAVIQVAHVMRLRGFDIPRKAEEEQAAVAYFKLQMYMKYGKEWEEKGVQELNAMPKVEPK